MTSFGNRIIADVIKTGSHWSRVGPESNMTGVLTRRHTQNTMEGHTDAEGRQPCDDTGSAGSNAPTSHGHRGLWATLEAERGPEQTLPQSPPQGASPAGTVTLDF